jgi:hypothetical protein
VRGADEHVSLEKHVDEHGGDDGLAYACRRHIHQVVALAIS